MPKLLASLCHQHTDFACQRSNGRTGNYDPLFLSLQQNFVCAVPSSDFPAVLLSVLKSPQKEIDKVFSSEIKCCWKRRESKFHPLMKCTTQESAVFIIRSKVREFPSSDRSIELAPIFSNCITWFPRLSYTWSASVPRCSSGVMRSSEGSLQTPLWHSWLVLPMAYPPTPCDSMKKEMPSSLFFLNPWLFNN